MTEKTDEPDRMDAPNQQAVRPDASGPADEGSGGSTPKNRGGRPRKDAEKPAEKPAAEKPAAEKPAAKADKAD